MAKAPLKRTRSELEHLMSTLKEVLNGALKGHYERKREGICGVWEQAGAGFDAYRMVLHIADSSYPIKGGYLAFMEHSREGTLWQGEQLQERIKLIRYLLKRLRDWHRRQCRGELTKAAMAARVQGLPAVER